MLRISQRKRTATYAASEYLIVGSENTILLIEFKKIISLLPLTIPQGTILTPFFQKGKCFFYGIPIEAP